MKTEDILLISASGTVVAAVGTVGALFASLAAFRSTVSERRRAEVRGVRGWIEWEEAEESKRDRALVAKLGPLGLPFFQELATSTMETPSRMTARTA